MATFSSGVKCFRSFLIRSLRYLNGRTLSPFPAEAGQYRNDPVGSIDLDFYSSALENAGQDLPSKARALLSGIRIEKAEADYARSRGVISQAVLPTLSSVMALTELRAVFQDFPSPSTSKLHRDAVRNLLGFEPMVVVGLETNDSSGNDSNVIFQATEKTLRNMMKSLEDALLQVEMLREEQKKFSSRS